MLRTILICLFCIPASLHALEWQATFKNVLRGPHNTFLYLRYQPGESSSGITRPQIVEINFRRKGSLPVILSKEQHIEIKGEHTFRIGFFLEPGTYEVDVDIADLLSGRHTPISVEYRCMIDPSNLSASDIFLSYEPATDTRDISPILDLNLKAGVQKLHFLTEIYAPYTRTLSLRAILYQEVDSLSSASTTIWLDIRKITRTLRTDGPVTTFGDIINISGLKEGHYLLQIHVYDRDSLILKPSTYFVLEGETRQRIFSDIAQSISMMRYILPPEAYTRLLEVQGTEQQESAFRQAWVQLYGEEADEQMKNYFKRLYLINSRLAQEGEDWQSDRARVFLQYGDPLVKDFEINGKHYQRWTYVKWDLSFLFEKRNQAYILVE